MGNVNFNEEFKDKAFKIAAGITLFVVLTILSVMTVVTVKKINKGEYVKVFGLEYNIPKEHPDTIVKTVKTKPDTIFKNTIKTSSVARVSLQRTVPKKLMINHDTAIKAVVPPTIQAKNYAGTNNGGHVGDNYYGTALEFTQDYGDFFINYIEKFRIDSNIISKSLVLNPFINCNSQKFGTDLMNYLKSKNYRVSIRYNVMTKESVEGIDVTFDRKENCFEIGINNMYTNKEPKL
ncbi:hypothetical protein [Mucilaginibacter ginsenosidivorax]|uniref:Uncharacterized protein n=1 Tax=Mucilaginibacter ginsenosidivorax TaxID=862126 RepID=A0A5B8W5Y0_9SPHI|nr:hypothetical protein [Mucilaginibacter ginsenosidivorax]QEC78356.1 hypothetical protein FSB76_21310 [Mucilaginibacter ginsenosidivorax]